MICKGTTTNNKTIYFDHSQVTGLSTPQETGQPTSERKTVVRVSDGTEYMLNNVEVSQVAAVLETAPASETMVTIN